MKRIIFNFIFLISIIPSYGGIMESGKLQEGGVKEITVSQLHQLLNNKDFILVNVHIPYAGEIPQTDLQIPYNKISNHLGELPAKDKKIVLYCRSDRMSTIASETLAKEGYSKLYNLTGGMYAWEAAGYRLIENQSSIPRE